jgi:hypothetical protein
MTEQLERLARLETYVGAAFVAFYGFERFRKPPSEPGRARWLYLRLLDVTAPGGRAPTRRGCSVGRIGNINALRRSPRPWPAGRPTRSVSRCSDARALDTVPARVL